MTADITQCACTEIPPAAPNKRMISRIIRTRGSGTQPQIPIQILRNFRGSLRTVHTLRPVFTKEAVGRTIGPNMQLTDFADRAGLDHFAETIGIFRSLALIAHLGRDTVLAGFLHHPHRFIHRVGQRFLAINMFLAADSGNAGRSVRVVRGSDHDRVDLIFHFIQHLAVVFVTLGLRELIKGPCRFVPIYVAESHDIHIRNRRQTADVMSALAADTDAGDPDTFAGRRSSVQTYNTAGDDSERCRRQRGCSQKMSSGKPMFTFDFFHNLQE